MSDLPEWQKEFQAWYKERYDGQPMAVFAQESDIPSGTFGKYLKDRPVRLDKLTRRVKQKLYAATGMKCFEGSEIITGRTTDGGRAPLLDWQLELIDHVEKHYNGSMPQFASKHNMSPNYTRQLIEQVTPIEKLALRTRDRLYRATKLETFRCDERYMRKTWDGKEARMHQWQIDLIRWMDDNNMTPKKIRQKVGLSENTLFGYVHKVARLDKVSRESKTKLYALTEMEVFNPDQKEHVDAPYAEPVPEPEPSALTPQPADTPEPAGDDIGSLVAEVTQFHQSVLERLPQPNGKREGDVIKQTKAAFYDLAKRLEYFKGDPNARERLTKSLSKSDVGRVTSLLHAIYKSEDDFAQWMFLSGYAYEGEGR